MQENEVILVGGLWLFIQGAGNVHGSTSLPYLSGEHELVRVNKLFSNFNLVGIQPAPKGVSAYMWIDGVVNVVGMDKDRSTAIISSSATKISNGWCLMPSSVLNRLKHAVISLSLEEGRVAMNEFKDQLDAAEKNKVAAKGQADDGTVTADANREKINETQ
ncbi:hypothetical protein EDB85DRAFT_1904876 [Lactarius pseudohatsudake]|nr:hypothetical protein EDB85DRAFT_1904876 [Lactarius pseudohatsudake]